jgi:hypothetical protein
VRETRESVCTETGIVKGRDICRRTKTRGKNAFSRLALPLNRITQSESEMRSITSGSFLFFFSACSLAFAGEGYVARFDAEPDDEAEG